jgi:hypothetical protein
MADSLGRFACMPSNNLDSTFFKNKDAIDESFVATNGVDEYGIFFHGLKPEAEKQYYVHVDLALKQDNCAVALAHVDSWKKLQLTEEKYELLPHVTVDLVRWWTPGSHRALDFAEVREFIVELRRRGFNIKLVTFDRWNSADTMNYLTNQHGIKTDTLSVANKHYDDFLSVMYGGRLLGPKVDLLIKELKELRYIKNKVDHPRKSSKDLSDAVCGAIFDAVKHTPPPVDHEVEILNYKSYIKQEEKPQKSLDGVIKAPPGTEVPKDIQEFLIRMRMV